ncbi:winged helix-turn-helix domain-containing protein [Sphaerotilus montanus]|uniref:winged helix-turn-helix domain-containing protein n=1 Tax=Sphaerotilus montanus TaxID=522889 RepID=UPI003FA21E1D
MRLLLAEDDPLLGDGLRAGLKALGFQVDWVRDGVAAERELLNQTYTAAILDLGLPRVDGMDVLHNLRTRGVATPVLVLTARDAVPQRIQAHDLGADDYVVKPVDLHELAARLRALVRRSHGQAQDRLSCNGVDLQPASREVWADGETVKLSSREFSLLHVLMLRPGRVLTREQLENHLYGWGEEVGSNTIEVHVHHLRRKLGSHRIRTVRGVGYAFAAQSSPVATDAGPDSSPAPL